MTEDGKKEFPRTCRVCGQIPFAFYKSRSKKQDWICPSCSKAKTKETKKRIREVGKIYE